jgi:hypothetical protein
MVGNEEAEDRRKVVLAESLASCILEACCRKVYRKSCRKNAKCCYCLLELRRRRGMGWRVCGER